MDLLREAMARERRFLDPTFTVESERVAQLLGVDPPVALALDREGRVEGAPLARERLAQDVHHLEPLGLRPVGEPALDLAQ